MAVEIMTVKTENVDMDYITFGNGEKLLVIFPGLSLKSVMLSKDAVASGYIDFVKEYKVYLFDQNKNIDKNYSIKKMADDTAEAMKFLGLKDVYLFGCSMGGMLALTVAAYYPEVVGKAVIASSLSRPNETSRKALGEWIEIAEKGDVKALNRSMTGKVYSPQFIEQYKNIFLAMENDGSREELKRFIILAKAARDFSIYDELDRIKCPVMIIGSWNDYTVSGFASVETAQKLRCPLFLFTGYGHAVYDEAEEFKRILRRFFSTESYSSRI